MSKFDTLAEVLAIVKELVKDNQIANAEAKIRNARDLLVTRETESDRAKVDELNKTMFNIKKELRILEAFILHMEKSHEIDLSDLKDQLNQFGQQIEAIRRKKKSISFR